MAYEFITVEIEEGVGIVTLNRPEKLNAMNNQLTSELHDAVKQLNADDDVGCIVLTGAGRFPAGDHGLGRQLELGADGAAAVHLDG